MLLLPIRRRTRTETTALGAPPEALPEGRTAARGAELRLPAGAARLLLGSPVRCVSLAVVAAFQATSLHSLRFVVVV